MRIVYDHRIFASQEYGGISRYYVEIAKRISQAPDVQVGVVGGRYLNVYLRDAPDSLQVMGRYAPARDSTEYMRRWMNRLMAPRMLARFQPDVVHETSYSAYSIAPRGAKTVVTIHDMIHELFPDAFSRNDSTSARKRASVDRADHVICVSEQTRQDLVHRFDVDPAKTSVIHHGVSAPERPVDLGRTAGQPFVLYVGKRRGHKNFETLLRAYAASDQLREGYDLVAFGGGAFKPWELALLDQLGLDRGRVRQCGGGDDLLARLYATAALFVYPSCYEGFGVPLLEAMSFDCPVVCSNVGAMREVVGDAADVFDPYSPTELALAMERVVSDPVHRGILIQRGRSRVGLFTWEHCAEQTLDVYRRVLS